MFFLRFCLVFRLWYFETLNIMIFKSWNNRGTSRAWLYNLCFYEMFYILYVALWYIFEMMSLGKVSLRYKLSFVIESSGLLPTSCKWNIHNIFPSYQFFHWLITIMTCFNFYFFYDMFYILYVALWYISEMISGESQGKVSIRYKLSFLMESSGLVPTSCKWNIHIFFHLIKFFIDS